MFVGAYLNDKQREKLRIHKYESKGTSLCEPLLQPLWNGLFQLVPQWIAPNVITSAGLISNILITIPLIILDPNSEGKAPPIVYIICAIGFFTYQILDALDGKQCRKTGCDTPIEELFDHGCDAVSTFLMTVVITSALSLQTYPLNMLAFVNLVLLLNFGYHWETYVSGVVHFKRLDVTEAQLLHITIVLSTGILGTDFWLYRVPYLDFTLNVLCIIGSYILAGLTLVKIIPVLFTEAAGKDGTTVAGTSVFSPLRILLLHYSVIFLYVYFSPGPLQTHSVLFFFAMVFPMVKSNIYLVVASMTKSPLPLFDVIMVGPFLAFANVFFGTLVPEVDVLATIAIFNVVNVVFMYVRMSLEICAATGVKNCLTLHTDIREKST